MSAKPKQNGWISLFRIACDLIRQANAERQIIDHWTLGGGTALMLQIDHRESDDIDIFLNDPQLLSFLDPQKHDFELQTKPAGYGGDGSGFLKLSFENLGEIDFIVSSAKTEIPTIEKIIQTEKILVETIPEIIAKKIFHRGSSIRARDIFDIAAAAEQHSDSIVGALRAYKTEVAKTIETLGRLNPEFVSGAIAELQIRPSYASTAKTALERATMLLQAV